MAGLTLPPFYFCNNFSGTGLQTPICDISSFALTGYPPVIQFVFSATGTVILYGAHDISVSGSVISMVNPQDVTGGGITASDFYDLIPGIRYYQANITANTGLITLVVGAGPTYQGATVVPHQVTLQSGIPVS